MRGEANMVNDLEKERTVLEIDIKLQIKIEKQDRPTINCRNTGIKIRRRQKLCLECSGKSVRSFPRSGAGNCLT